jgi:hypothetical protein
VSFAGYRSIPGMCCVRTGYREFTFVKPQFLTGYEQGVLIFFSQVESVTSIPRENLTG